MSYQVLARKWRPQNFKQMVGQEHVLQALIHALDSQRLHHAYLFTGTRGVGKTTIGRILAKCLSCHDRITSEPCGQCDACQAITQGRYVDLIEIDAASRTKVEDMRELLENVQYAPTQGRFKIYLIDEVHMLSQSSFNALLKTLEEPPEHVKFLFATTDPQKLPVTILSRCLQFNLKNMAPEKIVSHLSYVLGEESVTYEDAALWALALAADGSMRDALSLTDQAIAYGNHTLTESGVSSMLGTVDQKKVYKILDALITKNAPVMFDCVKQLADFSPDYRSVLATISSIFHRVAIEQVVPGSVDNAMGDQEKVQYFAQNLCVEDVQLFYQIALTSRQDLQIAPDPKAGFEMALLRMLAFQLTPVDPSTKTVLDYSEQDSSESQKKNLVELAHQATSNHQKEFQQGNGTEELNSLSQSAHSEPSDSSLLMEDNLYEELPYEETPYEDIPYQEVPYQEVPSETQASLNEEIRSDNSNLTPSFSNDHIETSVAIEQPQTSLSSNTHTKNDALDQTSGSKDNSKDFPERALKNTTHNEAPDAAPEGWNADVVKLNLSGMTLNFMLNSVTVISGNSAKVFIETGHYRLFNENHEKRIKDALVNFYTGVSDIEFIDGLQPDQETPMMWRERKQAEKKEYAKQLILNDSNVAMIMSEFQANLIEQSIQSEL